MTLLDAALDYCRRGWSVIPLRFAGSVEEQKRPLIPTWEEFQKQPATEEQVRAWWSKWPQANTGIVTGEVSGLIVVDLDGPNAVALLRSAKVNPPKTAAVSTGKGFHAYYRHPGYPVANRAGLLSDGDKSAVDVRGDGGYVVAPPSVHGSGRVYQWVVHPDEGITNLPADLAALIARKGSPASPTEAGDAGWVDEVMRGVPQGARDDTCARLAGYWLRHLDQEDVLRILRPWAARCEPPFPEVELRKTVLSVARREAVSKAAEQQRGLPRVPVIEAAEWLEEVETSPPRKGERVEVPGFSAVGGLVPGDLIVVAGRPGMGKSTIAAQLCVEAAIRRKVPTYVVSTEMTRRQWGLWMAAYLCDTTTEQLSRPLSEFFRGQWRSSPVAISDPGTIGIRDIRQLAESRLGLKLLIVDHIGRVAGGRRDSRVLEVGDVARQLKAIAKDLECAVVALCQLNRRVEGADEKRPRLDDLRESGEVEQEADVVLFLWTDERDRAQARLPMAITVAKHRHGPLIEIPVIFDKPGRRLLVAQKEAHVP
jgi:hypothetical protein